MSQFDVLKNVIKTAPVQPGVYKMYDKSQIIIYIGKAKNIKNRLTSYTKNESPKVLVLVKNIASIEFEITKNEEEALILEASLVKKHQPKFNILLKDDKSRLYIKISNHKVPAISTYRGKFDRKSHLFGPFGYIPGSQIPTNKIIKNIIDFTSKIFKIRSCKDTKFKVHKTMKKPCMEFQIGTCSAPCTDYISSKDYHQTVCDAISFLNGNYLSFQKKIKEKIGICAKNCEFIEANHLKNQLISIEKLRSSSNVNFQKYENIDIIVMNKSCDKVEVFAIRNGYALGGNIFDIESKKIAEDGEILENFIYQYYSNENPPPQKIFVNLNINVKNVKTVLLHLVNINCDISNPKRGDNKEIVDFVTTNLQYQTQEKIKSDEFFIENFSALQKEFKLSKVPKKIEVYDNSHTSGAFFVGSFIVVTHDGFSSSQYRKFNAKFTKGGDDYGMMEEVMKRRFGNDFVEKNDLPDLILIDGGAGQFNVVQNVLNKIGVDIDVISIAKGEDRNTGNEVFFTKNMKNIKVLNRKLLYFLQNIRDEAHRFAISTHRKRRERIKV